MTMKLNDRETATVLAALRNWQVDERNGDDLKDMFQEHFTDHEPLSLDEVDALCEAINTVHTPAEQTLDKIHSHLDGMEWDSDTVKYIAELMTAAGYVIRDPDDRPDTDEEDQLAAPVAARECPPHLWVERDGKPVCDACGESGE